MMFLDHDFLLNTQTAKKLYHEAASSCPIIDYHCHIDPREIFEDRRYDNITQVWLGGDHYKWRLMRSAGVEEKYITGDADDHAKFLKWAEVLGKAVGNPLYHWSHLELRRFFGYNGILNQDTAGEVWEFVNAKLRLPGYSVRGLISMSNVELICTTDDPADSLLWHEKLEEDSTFGTTVLPAWRPDRAMGIENADYPDYLARLEEASGVRISSFQSLRDALGRRMDYFAAHRCRLSDHGLNTIIYAPAGEGEIEEIFERRLSGIMPDGEEEEKFKYACLLFLADRYRRMDWVMQLHYGCCRNNNGPMYRKLGRDTGFDCVNNAASSAKTAALLGAMAEAGSLPKTILYSLNTNDNAAIDTIIGCFQNSDAVGYIQHGSAWWFDDHLDGMRDQLKSLAARGYLAGFVGMLTDSRSFLSYPRHEYFRRILCRVIGEWVEEGLYPEDYTTLKEIVRGICHDNAETYFGFL